mgnify:CR=1 FL=1
MVTIYTLQLHEELELDRYNTVKRVPGGWLYRSFIGLEKDNYNPVGVEFVPYNSEFVPAANLTPPTLGLGTYDYDGTSWTATNSGILTINYSGEFSLPLAIQVISVSGGSIVQWQYRKIGDPTWSNTPLSFSVVELQAGGGSINFECRKQITNHGAATGVTYSAVFELTGEAGIVDTSTVSCNVIGTVGDVIEREDGGR